MRNNDLDKWKIPSPLFFQWSSSTCRDTCHSFLVSSTIRKQFQFYMCSKALSHTLGLFSTLANGFGNQFNPFFQRVNDAINSNKWHLCPLPWVWIVKSDFGREFLIEYVSKNIGCFSSKNSICKNIIKMKINLVQRTCLLFLLVTQLDSLSQLLCILVSCENKSRPC